jgi:predicted enzyme related to lactoylglutathione lyase
MDKVTHFEIPADDKGESANFYEVMFGWKITNVPVSMGGGTSDYTTATTTATDPKTMMPTEPGSINGALVDRKQHMQAPVITVTVDSIEEHLGKVKDAHGKVLEGKKDIENMGSYAYVQDPAGNVVGLWEETEKPEVSED